MPFIIIVIGGFSSFSINNSNNTIQMIVFPGCRVIGAICILQNFIGIVIHNALDSALGVLDGDGATGKVIGKLGDPPQWINLANHLLAIIVFTSPNSAHRIGYLDQLFILVINPANPSVVTTDVSGQIIAIIIFKTVCGSVRINNRNNIVIIITFSFFDGTVRKVDM